MERFKSGARTRHDIARVHVVFVLDEAEAIHELDLGNLAGAMGVEVVLNIGLGSCSKSGQRCQVSGSGAWSPRARKLQIPIDRRDRNGREAAVA